ncbi:hypothetical protein An04g10190 [Aspergillus niger]|uniref:Uncharacterized protein n=2 Tax=Aspergillus niger TaxID=5061 RepID=A2QKD1_ASPNC|nr:hypothetical protein An04g10190 [Aspergillus niger]CAK44800.1 hypothetical protein An04g10190 [Aspergillus niger]
MPTREGTTSTYPTYSRPVSLRVRPTTSEDKDWWGENYQVAILRTFIPHKEFKWDIKSNSRVKFLQPKSLSLSLT